MDNMLDTFSHKTALETENHPSPRAVGPGSLTDLLVEAGMLSRQDVDEARQAAMQERLPLASVLVRDGLVLSKDLAALTALHLGLSLVDLRSQTIDPEAVSLLPEDAARRHLVLPCVKAGDQLTVAMTDPLDFQLLQDLSTRTRCAIIPIIATREDILEHVDIAYRATQSLFSLDPETGEPNETMITPGKLRNAPAGEILEVLLRQGLHDRASDIHIEPMESRLRIRFRIDGILHDVTNLPLEIHPALISRLKIMSGLNIAERRRPQDGQFAFEVDSRAVDVRVALSSTILGEVASLRLLDKEFTLMGLGQLGMTPNIEDDWRNLLKLPHGMLIVCGPTGAGKSSTLYASILQMNRLEQSIVSLEDPVEYRISGANQMQMNSEAGITFALQLRSVLRLDPDVIMVGEIRDQETAIIATQAALTGHLVLTSLHANDSITALLRLRDLGVAPYLIAPSVAGILAQRMVRVVCSACKTVTTRPHAEQQMYAAETGETMQRFLYGSGCNLCAQTGYRGRTGVFELLTVTDKVRQLFLSDAPRSEVLEQALTDGLMPLRQDGMMKVRRGVTTPNEIMRVLFSLG